MKNKYIVLQENEDVYTTLRFVNAEKIVYKRYKNITPVDKEFLKDEVKFLKNINHPFFQKIIGIEFTKNDAIITKKWFDGIDLLTYLKSHFEEQERLWVALLHFIRYLAYNDFVHFDLKPEHILISRTDDDFQIKIIDWSQEPGRFTPYWAAPEQFDGISDWKSNLYTIALIFYSLYESLNTISSSQKRSTPLKFSSRNRPVFWKMIENILHYQPKMRPDDMDEFISQLPPTDYIPPLVYPSTTYQNFFDFHNQLRDTFYTNQLSIEFSYYLFRKYVHTTPLNMPLWITNQKDSSIELKMPELEIKYVPLKDIIETEINERNITFEKNRWIFSEPTKKEADFSNKTPEELISALYEEFDKREYKNGAEIFSYIVNNKSIYSKLGFEDLLWLVKNLRLFLQEKKVEEISEYMLSNFALNPLEKYKVYQNLLNLYINNKVKRKKIENEINNLKDLCDKDTLQWINLKQKVIKLYYNKDTDKLEKLRLELERHKKKNYPIIADIDNYLIELYIEKGIDLVKTGQARNKAFQVMKNLHRYYLEQKSPWRQISLYNRMANFIREQTFPLFTLSLYLSLELNDRMNFYYTIFYLYYFLYTYKSDRRLLKNIFEILKSINREKDIPEYVSTNTKKYLLHYQINEQEKYGSTKKYLMSLMQSSKNISSTEAIQYLRMNFINHSQDFEQKYIDYTENNFITVWKFNSRSLLYHLRYLVLHFPQEYILKFRNILEKAGIDYLKPDSWIAEADFDIQLEYYFQTKNYQKMNEILNQVHWQSLKKFETAEFFYYKSIVEKNKRFKQSYLKKALLLFNKMGLKNRVKEVRIELEKSSTDAEKVTSIEHSLFKDLLLKFVQIDNINDLGKEIIRFLKDNFKVDKVIIFLYNKIEDRFYPIDFSSLDIFVEHKAKEYSRTILGKYKDIKEDILILDTLKLSKSRSISALDIKSAACIPLKIKGELIGTLYMDVRRRDYELTSQDLPFLNLFSTLLAVFINLTGSLERWKRRNLIADNERFHDLVGVSEKSKQVFEEIVMASRNNYPVLITGETGTGKELVARAIYKERNYKGKFIAINVASIPEHLFESTLFGYKKGAFTGAEKDTLGLVQQAINGVLFLDEISEIPISTQAKLLRFIEYGEYQPVGGEIFIEKSVRIIASSNKNLEKAIKQRKFREDLFYRLNVNHIDIPPLRERKDDIPCLVKHFVQKYYQENISLQKQEKFERIPKISDELVIKLTEKPWTGNARELENYIRNLLIKQKETISSGVALTGKEDIADYFKVSKYSILDLEELRKEYIFWLDSVFSNREELLKKLGISRSTYFRLKKRASFIDNQK